MKLSDYLSNKGKGIIMNHAKIDREIGALERIEDELGSIDQSLAIYIEAKIEHRRKQLLDILNIFIEQEKKRIRKEKQSYLRSV